MNERGCIQHGSEVINRLLFPKSDAHMEEYQQIQIRLDSSP